MKIKNYKLKLFVSLFIILSVFMSVFSHQISKIAARMLTMTGELQFYEGASEKKPAQAQKQAKKEPLMPEKIKKQSTNKETKTEQKIDLAKQVVNEKLPKTEKPYVLIVPDNNFNNYLDKMPAFPEMRLYTGEEWKKEKTIIFAAISPNILYIKVNCFDSNPILLVKEFSKTEGSSNAWKDDSVEIFLMKDPISDVYHQFIASASGKIHAYEYKIKPDDPRMGTQTKSFQAQHIAEVKEHEEGYTVEFKIPLSSVGFDEKNLKEGFNMQIVRNYRGYQKDANSATLQLFPVYIYGDNRFGTCNHHNKAFQKIRTKRM